MQNDPDGVRNPLLEQGLGRNGRRKRSTFLISVSLLAAIGGSWSGWQLRNQNSQAAIAHKLNVGIKVLRSAEATALASFGSPYGTVPRHGQLVAASDESEASLANELAKRAAGAHLVQQGSTNATLADARVSEGTAAPLSSAGPAVPASLPSADSATPAPLPAVDSAAQAADPPSERLPQQIASLANVAPREELTEPPALPSPAQITPSEPAAPQPLVQAPPVPKISTDDQQQMLLRVRTMLQNGDIAGARLILERLDRAGNGQASLYLAETYDPVMLNRWDVVGITPDAKKAMELYRRALDEGVPEAREHLTASVSQQP